MIEIPAIFWIGLGAGIVTSAIVEWIKSAARKRRDGSK